MIHVRVDIPERLRNLEIVMEYYHQTCTDVQFVIVNDDKQPDQRLRRLYEKYNDSLFLYIKNDSTYRRTLAFNKAFNSTNRPIVIAGDTDVIINPLYIKSAADIIMSGEYNHIYPYNGLFCWIKEHIVTEFNKNYDIGLFEKYKPEKHKRIANYEDNNILVAHPCSRGGCIMYSSELYRDINGYNPNFRGWGYEDDEIAYRVEHLGGKTTRIIDDNAIAWHLPHPNTIRDLHPFYDNNKSISKHVRSLNVDNLKKYINTWAI